MKFSPPPTARTVARKILASSIASMLLAGLAHGVTWSGAQALTLGVDPGGDDVDLLADTVVTLQGTGGNLVENVIFNAGSSAVTMLTVNNAAGATRALAANATVLGAANGRTLQIAGTADFRIGAVSDGGFANVQLVKSGGTGELILDNAANDLDGATLRVVDGTMSILGFGGNASAVDTLINAIRIDGVNAKLRLGTLTGPGTTFRNNLAVNESGTLEHTAASDDTLSGLVALASGKTLTANVTDGTLRLSGAFSRGAGSGLTKAGAGTMVLSGFGTGTGVTNVNGGTLQYAMPGSLYSGTTANWTAANITVASGATLAVNVGGASDFSPANVTTLLTQLSTVNNNGLKAGASFGFDTTNATGTVSYSSALTNSTGTGGGNVGFKKLGTGTLSLSGTNTYLGPTTVTGGTLQLTKPGALYNGVSGNWTPANVIVNSGTTLALNVGGATDFTTGNAATLLSQISTVANNGLKAGATVAFDTTNAVGTVAYASAVTDSTGVGGGTVSFTKLGTGTLSLDGASTYSGATTISAGTLSLGNAGSISNSSGILIAAGATYNVSAVPAYTLAQTLSAPGTGTANVTGPLNAGARTINLQDGANIGTLALGSTLTLSGATLRFDLAAASSDRITVGGAVSMSGTNVIDVARLASATGLATGTQAYTLITAGGGLVSGGFSLSNSLITIGNTNYTLSLSGDATHQYLGVTSGSVLLPTTYTLATSASEHNIRVGSGTSTITTTITNTGTIAANSDALSYTSLGGTASPGTGVTLVPPATGGTLAANASGTAQAVANQTFSSTAAGSYLVTASGGTVTNTTVGGSPVLQGGIGTDTINVWRLAAPSAIGTPLTFSGNHHVGDVVAAQNLSLTNTAAADGFSEKLDAAIVTSTGGAVGTGSVSLLAAGANSTALQVGLDTSEAGALSGSVTVSLTSNGTGTSGLGTFALAPQVITVNAGSVYRLAAPNAIGSQVTFVGNYHVGDTVTSQALTLTNDAANDGFSERLDAAFTGSTGGATGTGAISLLAPEDTNTTSLLVGLNTGTVGAKSGTVTVGLTSNGAGTSLLGTTGLGVQVITVNAGSVFRLATANTIGAVTFSGNHHVGDVVGGQALSLTNTAAADGFSEALDAAFTGSTGGASGSGSVSLLAAGATSAGSLMVGLDTSAVGAKGGTVTVGLTSNGAGTSALGTTGLGSQVITVNAGSVFRLAAPGSIGNSVTLPNVHVGDIFGTSALSITNTAANDGFSEGLDAATGSLTGDASGAGTITNLLGTSTAISVSLSGTATAGVKSGTVDVLLTSSGANSGLANTALAPQTVTVSGSVFRLAAPGTIGNSVTLPNVHVGDTFGTSALSITNTAANDGFSEGLNATTANLTGDASAVGTITNLLGTSTAISVTLGGTATAGAKTGTVDVLRTSNGANSGLANTALAPQTVTVSGSVFRLAAAGAIASPVVFSGNHHVGDVVTGQALTISNEAVADGFSEGLDAAFIGSSGGALGSGTISLLAPGGSNAASLLVGLDTASVGAKSGTVTVGFTSNGAGTSLLGTTALGSQVITVNAGSVFRLAAANTIGAVTFSGNHHVGDVVTPQALSLTNTAAADSFSERLDAAFTGSTGGATTAGSISLLTPGTTNAASLSVGLNTNTAGAKSGTVTVGLTSNGAGTSLLGTTSLAPQVVTVNAGSVFRYAAPGVIGTTVTLPNVHVGGTFASVSVPITNTAPNDGFSEGLSVQTGNFESDAEASGTVTNLIGTSNAITVTMLDVASAGPKSGTVDLFLTSDGTNSDLASTALAPVTVTVEGNVFCLATASLISPVTFAGNHHVGDIVPAQALALSNTRVDDGYSEKLDAGFTAATGGATGTGTISLLAPGGSNATSLLVGLNTATVGAKAGTVTVGLTSNGADTSLLGTTGLAAQTITVNAGSVFRFAVPGAIGNSVTLANVHVGETFGASALSITNTAANDGFSEGLSAATANLTGDASAGGAITNLLGTSTAISVSLGDTATAGAKTGTVDVLLTSSGANSGLANTALAPQTVTVSGSVFRLASANSITTPINFAGNHHVGDVVAPMALSLTNLATADGFSEKLDALFAGSTGGVSGTGAVSLLAPEGSDTTSLLVGLNTGTVGAKSGTVTVGLSSNGAGTSVLGTTALGSQVITVNAGSVYRLAAASSIATPITFLGNHHVGDVVSSAVLTLTNTAVADGFSEKLDAAFVGSTGGASGAGTVTLLGAGDTDETSLVVTLDTTGAGGRSGTVTVGFTSNGAGTSLLGTTALGSQVITVNAGSVFRLASPNVIAPVTFVGNHHVGDVVTGQALTISNEAVADGFSEGLDAAFLGSSGGALGSGTISLLAPGGSNAASLFVGLDTASVGAKSGTVTVGLTSNGVGTSLLGTTGLGSQTITVNAGSVFRLAAPGTIGNSVMLANVHVGDTFGASALSIANTAANDGFSEGLSAATANLTGDASAAGAITNLLGTSTAISVSLGDTATAGAKTGTVDVLLTSSGANSGLANTALATQTVTVSGAVFNLAAAGTITPSVNLGRVRVGGTFGTAALTVTNIAAADTFTEGLNATFSGTSGAVTHNSGTISNLAGAASNATSLVIGLAGAANTATAGAVTGTVTVGLASNGTASSLADTALPTQVVSVSGFVYSGLGVWNLTGSGAWVAIPNWQANGGVPGLDAGFTATDTATFAGGVTGSPVVSLDGASPSLKAVTFDNAAHGYEIDNAGGGTLKLDNGAASATVTNSAGSHVISAPVELRSDTVVAVTAAGDALAITGSVTQSGARSLTKTGEGTLTLGGDQLYDTLVTSGGTTNINGVLGTVPGSATVQANANTRFGSVSQTLASLSIGAGATVTFTSGAAAFSGGGKASALSGGAVVPEPSAFGLLLVGALGMLGRRRRG
ncbi:MAG: choice-of-anchor D domain-containing protein [Chthoniobacter sp.]|nr:choice-of-anchor D domain-containing protein [Chthoniobacter sp.]